VEQFNADVTAPDSGQAATPEVGEPATSEAPSYEYVDLDGFGDKYVKVKIDGEELDVPLSEAVSGYQRQADYTRKTQELASQRENLQRAATIADALERDPMGTLDVLGRYYGANQPFANQQMPEPEPEFTDPLERQVWELNQKIASFEQSQAQQELEREVSRLQTTYPDFNPVEVITAALQAGTDNLEAVYKQMAYDKLVREVQTYRQATSVMSDQEKAVEDAKRQAAFVAGGESANGAGTEPVGRISSVQDAWLAAKRQAGM
jgi:hypothetical protein